MLTGSAARTKQNAFRQLVAVAFSLGCSSETPESQPACLTALSLDGGALEPGFSPAESEYSAHVRLLTHSVNVRAEAAEGCSVTLMAAPGAAEGAAEDAANDPATLEAQVALEVGDNTLEFEILDRAGEQRLVTIQLHRSAAPWQQVQLLTAQVPKEDGFFGDYLRATESQLYVNSERRGLLYTLTAGKWEFERGVDSLFSVELEWMYEAALDEATLALVAQPLGGAETLYILTRDAKGDWSIASEHPAGAQGSVRLLEDRLVLVTERDLTFFRRDEGGWQQTQTLAAPATDVGFAERPTYFDARSVSLSHDLLVVGAPRDSSPATGVNGSLHSDCDAEALECAHFSGATFVFERNQDGLWQHTAYLKPPMVAPELEFGTTTASDGDWIAVGTPNDGDPTLGFSRPGRASRCAEADCLPESGAVFLFQRVRGMWQPAGSLKPQRSRAYDYFGDTMIMKGDTLLVGAPGQDGAAEAAAGGSSEDSGGIYVFVRDGDTYRELGLHKLPDQLTTFPFPGELQRAGNCLVVAANQAPFASEAGETLANAGRVFYLY